MAAAESLELADRRFVKAAMHAPLLGAEHEFALARRWRDDGDEQALHELTGAYMRLAISMAGRFKQYGLPRADLVQEGAVGLMQAAARFEPERGLRFSTYAAWWIRSCMQDYILRNWSIVRTGTTSAQKALFFNLRRLRAALNDVGDARLSPEARAAVALELEVDEHEVDAMAGRLSASDRSLNAQVGGEDSTAEWQDLLVCDRPAPDAEVMDRRDAATRNDLLGDAMATLKPREQAVITERRLSDTPATLEVLGARLGISKERVRQIEQTALIKLRRALEQRVGDPWEAGLIG